MEALDLYREADIKFLLPEAIEVIGSSHFSPLSKKTIYNWNERGIIRVEKDRYSGRAVFSPFDLLQLVLLTDIAYHGGLDPARSAVAVRGIVDAWRKHCEAGKPLDEPMDWDINLEGESRKAKKPAERDRFPVLYLSVPLDIIASDLADAMFNFLRHRRPEEQSTIIATRKRW